MIESRNGFEEIIDKNRIGFILDRLTASGAKLDIHIATVAVEFSSEILSVNHDRNIMQIAGLLPHDGNDFLNEKKVFLVKSALNGVELTFQSELTATEHAGEISHHIRVPSKVNYYQRRTAYRIELKRNFAPRVTIVTKEKFRIDGRIINISIGGVRMEFDKPRINYFEEGERIPDCVIQLSPTTHIKNTMEVRDCHYDNREKILSIGAQFTNLSKLQQTAVGKYVASMERESRRRGTG